MADKFWMVWNPQGNYPHVTHQTPEAASSEAERLARKHTGVKVYLLEAISVYETEEPPVHSETLEMPGGST